MGLLLVAVVVDVCRKESSAYMVGKAKQESEYRYPLKQLADKAKSQIDALILLDLVFHLAWPLSSESPHSLLAELCRPECVVVLENGCADNRDAGNSNGVD